MNYERDVSFERSLDDWKQREESDDFADPEWRPSRFMAISILAEYAAQSVCKVLGLPWGYWACVFRRADWVREHGGVRCG